MGPGDPVADRVQPDPGGNCLQLGDPAEDTAHFVVPEAEVASLDVDEVEVVEPDHNLGEPLGVVGVTLGVVGVPLEIVEVVQGLPFGNEQPVGVGEEGLVPVNH